jgi:hypothetical protein
MQKHATVIAFADRKRRPAVGMRRTQRHPRSAVLLGV